MKDIEHDFGWWRTGSGIKVRLTWRARDGLLYLAVPGGPDHALRIERDERVIRHLLDGWETWCDRQLGMEWLEAILGVHMPTILTFKGVPRG